MFIFQKSQLNKLSQFDVVVTKCDYWLPYSFHSYVHFHTTPFPIEWDVTRRHGTMMQKNGLRQYYSYTEIIIVAQFLQYYSFDPMLIMSHLEVIWWSRNINKDMHLTIISPWYYCRTYPSVTPHWVICHYSILRSKWGQYTKIFLALVVYLRLVVGSLAYMILITDWLFIDFLKICYESYWSILLKNNI